MLSPVASFRSLRASTPSLVRLIHAPTAATVKAPASCGASGPMARCSPSMLTLAEAISPRTR